GVILELKKGETLAIVGESGSSKSVTSKEITRLNPRPQCRVKSGEILFEGNDLTKYSNRQLQGIRGKEISMIFQDPMTTLNPTMTIGKQITEGLRKHQNMRGQEAKSGRSSCWNWLRYRMLTHASNSIHINFPVGCVNVPSLQRHLRVILRSLLRMNRQPHWM